MSRTVGTTKEELDRLSDKRYKPWLDRHRTSPENIRGQYLILAGEPTLEEAESTIKKMLARFHPDILARSVSLSDEEKRTASAICSFLNVLNANLFALEKPAFERETFLIEEQKRKEQEHSRGGDREAPPVGGAGGPSLGENKPSSSVAPSGVSALGEEEILKKEFERLDALELKARGFDRITPKDLRDLGDYDRYKTIDKAMRDGSAVSIADVQFSNSYIKNLLDSSKSSSSRVA